MTIDWPDITFGPVNLIILSPAWWFYSTQDERDEYLRSAIDDAKETKDNEESTNSKYSMEFKLDVLKTLPHNG